MNKVESFADLIRSVHETFLWTFDNEMSLISTDCPDESRFLFFFSEEFLGNARSHCLEHNRPLIAYGDHHTTWIIDAEKDADGKIIFIYIFGPFFTDSFPEKTVTEEMEASGIPISRKYEILALLRALPLISFPKVMEYSIVMHYAVTSEKISIEDLHYPYPSNRDVPDDGITEYHGTYEAEKEMLRMVREGDLSIVDHLRQMNNTATIGKLANDDSEPMRQLKNTILVGVVLFSRAAIEGGLYPETAMTLTDRYFQAIEAAKNFQEIADIGYTMQDDFVSRVHKIKVSRYPKPVQNVIDYVQLHLEDDIFIENIAGEMGYSNYYLTKMFRKETGMTFKEFIRDQRLEKARTLLGSNLLSVGDIADKLRFSSTSYFIESFRKKYGQTPSEYRNSINA